MVILLLLLHTVAAKRLLDGRLTNHYISSSWKFLQDFLLAYPTLSTILSVILMCVFYAVIRECRKKLQTGSEINVLLKPDNLEVEKKPLKDELNV